MQTNTSSRQLKIACLAVLSASLTSVCTAQLTTPTFQLTPDSAQEGSNPGFVGTWQNTGSAGSALDVTQATSTAQPALITSATPTGESAVSFGGGDNLSVAGIAASTLVNGTAGTMFLVLRPTAQDAVSYLQWQGTNQRLQAGENGNAGVYVHGPFGGSTFEFASATLPGTWNDNWHVLTLSRNGGSATIRVDGVNLAVTDNFSGAISGTGTLNIGSGPLSGGVYLDTFIGDIAEIRVYNSAPLAGELAAIETELNNTYLTVVPEPSEYAMIFGGICLLGAVARRYFRRSEANAIAA